jgi:TRAP-type uncharacterized transport system substrate-binding protein
MAEKTALVLGTATPGGGFPAYGWPYAEVLNEMDPTLAIQPVNTKGSTENVPLLEQAVESTLANTLAAAPSRDLIHPGVLRYMREAGLVR